MFRDLEDPRGRKFVSQFGWTTPPPCCDAPREEPKDTLVMLPDMGCWPARTICINQPQGKFYLGDNVDSKQPTRHSVAPER